MRRITLLLFLMILIVTNQVGRCESPNSGHQSDENTYVSGFYRCFDPAGNANSISIRRFILKASHAYEVNPSDPQIPIQLLAEAYLEIGDLKRGKYMVEETMRYTEKHKSNLEANYLVLVTEWKYRRLSGIAFANHQNFLAIQCYLKYVVSVLYHTLLPLEILCISWLLL